MTWLRADQYVKGPGSPTHTPGFQIQARQIWDGDDADFSEVSVMNAVKSSEPVNLFDGSHDRHSKVTTQTADVARSLRKKLRHRMRMQAFENDCWMDDWASSKVHMFAEILQPNDELFKKLSKQYNLDMNMIESIFNIFQRYDEDGSGEIEYEEFSRMMCEMLAAAEGDVPEKRLHQFWQEIDIDKSRCIEFEEFLLFYVQNFLDPTDPHGSPMKNFYRRAAQRNMTKEYDANTLDDMMYNDVSSYSSHTDPSKGSNSSKFSKSATSNPTGNRKSVKRDTAHGL
jgi:hypothetical protein